MQTFNLINSKLYKDYKTYNRSLYFYIRINIYGIVREKRKFIKQLIQVFIK